jgi:hypothetical protein
VPGQTPQGEPQKNIYLPAGASGGGGAGGTYVFTDLEHLDRIIGRWKSLRDDILSDILTVSEAVRILLPPAEDTPSVRQVRAASESLTKGQEHGQAMADYAARFIAKLEATRAQYATTEQNNTDAIRNVGSY